jgi:hypothetical protein
MRLRKQQSFTVRWEKPRWWHRKRGPGRVRILTSPDGRVIELAPGDQAVLDATLDLNVGEGGWELLA